MDEGLVRRLTRLERKVAGLVSPELPPFAIGCRVYNSSNLSVNDTTYTALTFNSERFDTDGIHSTVSNTDRLTAARDGIYLIFGHCTFETNGTGVRFALIQVNTTNVAWLAPIPADASFGVSFSIATVYELTTGDYAQLKVYQNSGGSLNILADGNRSPEFGMVRLA